MKVYIVQVEDYWNGSDISPLYPNVYSTLENAQKYLESLYYEYSDIYETNFRDFSIYKTDLSFELMAKDISVPTYMKVKILETKVIK